MLILLELFFRLRNWVIRKSLPIFIFSLDRLKHTQGWRVWMCLQPQDITGLHKDKNRQSEGCGSTQALRTSRRFGNQSPGLTIEYFLPFHPFCIHRGLQTEYKELAFRASLHKENQTLGRVVCGFFLFDYH